MKMNIFTCSHFIFIITLQRKMVFHFRDRKIKTFFVTVGLNVFSCVLFKLLSFVSINC